MATLNGLEVKAVKKMKWHDFYDSLGILVEELITLKKLESVFKKVEKDGKVLLVAFDDYSKELNSWKGPSYYTPLNNEELIQAYSEKLQAEMPNSVLKVFRSLEDFQL